MGNPPWACLRKKDLGWDRGVESKKVVQHVYLVGAKSIYRVAEKDKEYLRDEEEKNQNVQGTNYLAEDCNRLISFFDARSGRPGADNLFEDLFVSVSEQEDDPAQPTLFELLYQQMDKEPQKAESGGSSKSLDQDEKFSLLAPYVKLSADPQEVYLNMRVRGGVATEEEKQKLIQLQNQRTQKEKIVKYFYIKQTAPKVARFDASYFGGSFTLCGGWAGRYRP